MMSKVLISLCAFLALSAAVDCKAKIPNPNGKTYAYDLTKLGHPAGEADTLRARDDEGNYVYVNICGPSAEKCTSGTAVCMRTADYSDYVSLGMVDSQEFTESVEAEPGKGLQVTYSNGDDCDFGYYQTVISVVCDPDEQGTIDTVEDGECWYRMTIRSKYGCGKEWNSEDPEEDESGSSKDAGEVVAIVILVLLLVSVVAYFALGAVWQKKKHDASTFREYIIHNEFWCDLPSLIVDGVKFILHGFRKENYTPV